jgi:NADH-quinone oxidoreductase subunit D
MGVEITPRCRYLRTLLSEYSRIADHLTCVAASLMELGAMTAFLYLVMIRDYIYEHLADLTGARVTYSYGRIGGLARDLPEGWLARLGEILDQYEVFVGRIHGLMDRNRIFIDRTRNVGRISTADAINWGFTGPILRSTGAAARSAQGRALPRVRRARLRRPRRNQRRQLRSLLRADARDGRVGVHDPAADGHAPGRPDQRRRPPLHVPRQDARLQRDRVADQPLQARHGRPRGSGGRSLYGARSAERRARVLPRQHGRRHAVQGPRALAELRPHGRVHRLLEGYQLADIIPTFGSVNMIGGECDR